MESSVGPAASGGCLSEISKRLEQGWTLLNELCPICSCALLKDTKTREVYCAKCGMYCLTADEASSLGTQKKKNVTTLPPEATIGLQQATALLASPARTAEGPSNGGQLSSASTPQTVRAEAEARMGEQLLAGWVMLADECPTPGCCIPLMLDDRGNTICVSCGGNGAAAPINLEVAPLPAPNAASARDPIALGEAPPAAATLAVSEEASNDEEVMLIPREQFAAVRKKRDALSASLGRYMLQGWSLLERTCPTQRCEPGTPLLKDRTSGTLYCAGCDTRMTENDKGVLLESTPPSSPTGLPAKRDSSGENRNLPTFRTETAGSECKAQPMQVDNDFEMAERARLRKQAAREQSSGALSASAGLAERLLQGWTMLSAACPEAHCHSPLMRDRQGKEMCVSCSAAPPRKDPEVPAVVQAAGEMGMEEEDHENDRALRDDDVEGRYLEKRRAELFFNARAAPDIGTSAGVVLGSQSAIDHPRVKQEALDTLYKALDVSQQRLRVCCGGSVGVDESARQADLIAKLAMAARAVFDLPAGSRQG